MHLSIAEVNGDGMVVLLRTARREAGRVHFGDPFSPVNLFAREDFDTGDPVYIDHVSPVSMTHSNADRGDLYAVFVGI